MSVHNGHRERSCQEFLSGGLAHFSEPRVLELLLFYSRPRGDVNPLAHQLLETFGSLAGVLDASPQTWPRSPAWERTPWRCSSFIPAIAAGTCLPHQRGRDHFRQRHAYKRFSSPISSGRETSFRSWPLRREAQAPGREAAQRGARPRPTRSTCERSRPSPSPSTPPPWSWPTTTPAGWPRPPRKIFFSPIMCSSHCSPWALRCTIMSSSRTTTWSPCGTAAT